MTVYEWLKNKAEQREIQEKARRKMPIFANNETLPVINEKARLHNMSYGTYVLARENGEFREEYGTIPKMKHEARTAWCKNKKRTY